MIELFPAREVLLQIGDWQIRWYGVLYVVAFGLAYLLLPRLQKYRGLNVSKDQWLEIFTAAVTGVIIGGRLGYVVFYEPSYFLAHPAEIFTLWQGGMSSHGGFIGVGLALWWAAQRLKINLLALIDIAVVPIALGLALGRLGNFINQELYVSTAAHLLAIGKDLLIAGVCYYLLTTPPPKPGPLLRKEGQTTTAFLLLYALLRFLTEYLRFQEWPLVLGLTRGQILTLPIILVGGLLYKYVRRQA